MVGYLKNMLIANGINGYIRKYKMEIPRDVSNIIVKYYWKQNDKIWTFISNTSIPDRSQQYDYLCHVSSVVIQIGNVNHGDDHDGKQDYESTKEINSKNDVFLFSKLYEECYKYDIGKNQFLKFNLIIPDKFGAAEPVYCNITKKIHFFSSRYHYCIGLQQFYNFVQM